MKTSLLKLCLGSITLKNGHYEVIDIDFQVKIQRIGVMVIVWICFCCRNCDSLKSQQSIKLLKFLVLDLFCVCKLELLLRNREN